MPSKEAELKTESPVLAEAAGDEVEGGPDEADEVEVPGAVALAESAEPKKRSHHKKVDGEQRELREPRESRESRGRKGSLVDDFLKSAKKVHPVYWVLGLGGAALAIDYFMEGDKSVVSSLYRGIFGDKLASGESGEGAARPRPIVQMVVPTAGTSYAVPYYPAFPPPVYAAPRYPGYGSPGFGGRPGYGYGGRMGGMGHGGRGGHAGVRGQFPWE